jgi:type III pantothenate kinase
MILLLDIGNTHTHLGLGNDHRVGRAGRIPTAAWIDGTAAPLLARFVGRAKIHAAILCSVVPRATPRAVQCVQNTWQIPCPALTSTTVRGIGIDYPQPGSIGPDRLANAVAARHHFGAPAVVVDFGTAVTFDVLNRRGDYVGGIIAPGLAAMTDYLHEKTALLPRIRIREPRATIGRNTEQAMLAGAVYGYRGLVRELIGRLKRELNARRLPVVATGGCARLLAKGMPEITRVVPNLTIEGLRLVQKAHALEPVNALESHCLNPDTPR